MTEATEWRPRIASVKPGTDRSVSVVWSDGTAHDIDLAAFLHDFEVFRPLDDDVVFAAVTVGEFGASLHWTDEAEIAASTLRRLALEQDADRFRQWRKTHDLSQEAAGEALGLKRRMVQYYEAGGHPIPKTVKLAMVGYDFLERGHAA